MDERVMRHPRSNMTPEQKDIMRNKRYAPATGVQADFEKVLMLFVKTKSVRFEDFAQIWREKKLSLICAGRQSMREVKEFVEECLKIALKMFLPPYGFQARVGALYLLYGLYYTQPCHPRVKIRVTQEAWKHITDLEKDLQQQNHHDTNYILQKLLTDGAFTFCCSLETKTRSSAEVIAEGRSLSSALTEEKQSIDELFSEEVFEQLHLIHTQYHQLKVKLAGPDATRPDRSLDVLQDKFPNSVADELVKHHERCQRRQAQSQSRKRQRPDDEEHDMNSGEEEDSDPEYQPRKKTVGQRRALLKKQAYVGAKNIQRVKHRNLIVESTVPETEETSPKKRRRGRPRKTSEHDGGSQEPAVLTESGTGDEEQQSGDNTEGESSSQVFNMPHVEETVHANLGRKPGRPPKTPTDAVTPQGPTGKQVTAAGKSAETNNQAADIDGSAKQKRAHGSHVEEDAPSAAQAKRKRGRPPKQKSCEEKSSAIDKGDNLDNESADEHIIHLNEGEIAESEKETLPTPAEKRKRGRPRKDSQTKPGRPPTAQKTKGGKGPVVRPVLQIKIGKKYQ